jgi:hypothetical protein
MVRLGGTQSESSLTLSKLHGLVAGCKIGSEGLLKPGRNSSPGTSFGFGLDCPGHHGREFLSITIRNHRIATVYYLPDEPVWVLAAPPPSGATIAEPPMPH